MPPVRIAGCASAEKTWNAKYFPCFQCCSQLWVLTGLDTFGELGGAGGERGGRAAAIPQTNNPSLPYPHKQILLGNHALHPESGDFEHSEFPDTVSMNSGFNPPEVNLEFESESQRASRFVTRLVLCAANRDIEKHTQIRDSRALI